MVKEPLNIQSLIVTTTTIKRTVISAYVVGELGQDIFESKV